MPVRPLCHGTECLRSGSQEGFLRLSNEVGLDVRHVGLVERLEPPEPDDLGGHPVGEHEDVASDRLAGAELVAHLGEELVVAVDVRVVGDLDPGLLLEVVEGGVLLAVLVHVERPVGEDQLLLRRRTCPCSCSCPRSAWCPRCRSRPAGWWRRARGRRLPWPAGRSRREKPGARPPESPRASCRASLSAGVSPPVHGRWAMGPPLECRANSLRIVACGSRPHKGFSGFLTSSQRIP